MTFSVGAEDWPFPVPLARQGRQMAASIRPRQTGVLARRIGRNELNAIEVCRGYAEAQLEYAAGDRDRDRVLQYAQKIVSTPGKQDGLYSDGGPRIWFREPSPRRQPRSWLNRGQEAASRTMATTSES